MLCHRLMQWAMVALAEPQDLVIPMEAAAQTAIIRATEAPAHQVLSVAVVVARVALLGAQLLLLMLLDMAQEGAVEETVMDHRPP